MRVRPFHAFYRPLRWTSLVLGLTMLTTQAAPPTWWTTSGAVSATIPSDDAAVATVGQAMRMVQGFETHINTITQTTGCCGPAITARLAAYKASILADPKQNYAVINLGQLKYLSKLCYDQLRSLNLPTGLTSGQNYPWTTTTADDADNAVANIGQLKKVFAFPLPTTPIDSTTDTDGDGLTDVDEARLGTNPLSKDTDGDKLPDKWEVVQGFNPLVAEPLFTATPFTNPTILSGTLANDVTLKYGIGRATIFKAGTFLATNQNFVSQGTLSSSPVSHTLIYHYPLSGGVETVSMSANSFVSFSNGLVTGGKLAALPLKQSLIYREAAAVAAATVSLASDTNVSFANGLVRTGTLATDPTPIFVLGAQSNPPRSIQLRASSPVTFSAPASGLGSVKVGTTQGQQLVGNYFIPDDAYIVTFDVDSGNYVSALFPDSTRYQANGISRTVNYIYTSTGGTAARYLKYSDDWTGSLASSVAITQPVAYTELASLLALAKPFPSAMPPTFVRATPTSSAIPGSHLATGTSYPGNLSRSSGDAISFPGEIVQYSWSGQAGYLSQHRFWVYASTPQAQAHDVSGVVPITLHDDQPTSQAQTQLREFIIRAGQTRSDPIDVLTAFQTDVSIPNQGIEAFFVSTNAPSPPILPVQFITKGASNGYNKPSPTLLIHGEQPRVVLDPVSNGSVTISGLTATLNLSGGVTDAIMGSAPVGGGADIPKVSAYVNDSPSNAESTLVRQPQAVTFWAPYSDKASFSGLVVQIPATGIQRVRVETSENAAGLKGSAEVEIVFSQNWSPPTVTASINAIYDLILPSVLTATVAETIDIAQADGAPFANLLETGPDTKIFKDQSTGITLWLNSIYSPSPQADTLSCTLHVPTGPLNSGDSSGGLQVTCQETGPQTLRFRHTSNLAASTAGGAPTESLRSVTLLDGGPDSTAYPISFTTPPIGGDLHLNLFGVDFPIQSIPAQAGNSIAITQSNKPLIGFLVRKQNTVTESESLEFIYYDHSAGALNRIGMPATTTEETWQLKSGAAELLAEKLPLKRISMLNADGSAGEGFVPVDIDTLIAIAGGDTYVEIQEDSQFIYEFSGVKLGEVLRVASQDLPADRFDLIVPGAAPKLTPHTRKVELIMHAPGIYRTQQKVVVYTPSPDGPQTLTNAQWETLKGLGYLAIHNGGPTVRCAADIDQFLASEGITDIHPPSDIAFGDGASLPSKSQAFRHKGFTDHHTMNVYHDNLEKSKKWRGMLKSMFGTDFDPDEFTIPVHAKVHGKTQHLATNVWDDLIEGVKVNGVRSGGISTLFDADGKLLPGVTSQQVTDLKYRTWTAMDDSINAMSGTKLKVDRGRMRIWPAVLDKQNHPLRQKFLQGGWRMGSSVSEYMKVDKIVEAGIKDASKLTRLKGMRKTLAKSVFKGGMKAVAISLACSILKGYAAAEMAYGTLVNGWRETLAQKLNDEIGLEDIELARQIISSAFSTDVIPGGTRVVQHKLPNGNLIVEGDHTFRCYFPNGKITAVDDFIVTEMKIFPEGTFKMAIIRTTPPHDIRPIIVDPDYFIRGWFPHVGADASEYWDALSKAERNSQ